METQFRSVLSKYLPEESLDFIVKLFVDNGVSLVVTKSRKTKLGSFIQRKGKVPLITINFNLNPYYFLVVLVHELAHYFSWKKNQNKRVAPHGQQWKNEFGILLKQLIGMRMFPEDLVETILNYINHNFNSTKANFELNYVLSKYQKINDDKILLVDLEDGSEFYYKKKKYRKVITKSSRCHCIKIDDKLNRKYSFHLLTEINVSE